MPIYDRGQLVSPAHWGDNWPISRGFPTVMGQINDAHMHLAPGQVALFNPPEPDPISVGVVRTIDALGHSGKLTITQRVWLIGQTNASDERLRDWAKSFSTPPSIDLAGAHLDFPTFSQERRAIRIIADSPSVLLKLTPASYTVNPVFEISNPKGNLLGITIDGVSLSAADFSWDGGVLWTRVSIDVKGAAIGLKFGHSKSY
jgi:hypothetical protein